MHYHFIGIGGIGMSGIAKLLLACGKKVSGSDIKESRTTQDLEKLGARIFIGHDPGNILDTDLIIYSSAIKADNPEMIEAKRRNLLLLKRAQALAELMQDRTVVTVTGSHGKTTTTALASCLFLEAGLSPTVAIGGILKNIDTNACLGEGRFFVTEADESDGSFLYYQPKYSIITNIDYEHLDYYQNFQNVLDAYSKFLNRTDKGGCVFACADDINLKKILKDYKNKYILFGLNENPGIYAKNIRAQDLSCEFECVFKGKSVDKFYLALGGMHNISNSLAVIALALELKIDLALIKNVLVGYKGTGRRLEIKFRDKRYILIDDYAHHPTEIRATLLAVRNLKPKRLIAIFQPHRYTRTKLLLNEFARSFDLADYLILTDIYPAEEPVIAGISKELISEKIKIYSPDKQVVCLKKEEIAPFVLKNITPGDMVITLGAGDIVKINDELVEAFKGKA